LAFYRILALTSNPRLWQKALLTLIHGVVALIREMQRDIVHVRAATLSYWTLVAIVPVLLLAFSLMGPLGLLDTMALQLKVALYETILAASIQDVAAYLDTLVSSVRLETLGIAGFLGVLFTGSKMYFNVEQAYNDIFDVRIRRGWFVRMVFFYAIVTLGPLLLSLGFVATSSLGTTLPAGLWGRMVPVGLTCLAFVLGIKLLPQAHVRWRAALMGGLTSAILFESAKFGFSAYTLLLNSSSNAARIYGSLGLLPVFLTWLYLLWFITLLGVEVAYVVQHAADLLPNAQARLMAPDDGWRQPDGFFGLQVMVVVGAWYLSGRGPLDTGEIAGNLGSTVRAVVLATDVLERAGLLIRSDDGRLLPARPLDDLSVGEVVNVYRAASVPLTAVADDQEAIRTAIAALCLPAGADIATLARSFVPRLPQAHHGTAPA